MPYRTLNADNIIATLETLHRRITERFPERGLVAVCAELLAVAEKDAGRAAELNQPNRVLRWGVAAVLIAGIVAVAGIASLVKMNIVIGDTDPFSVLEGVDALLNTVILAAAGVFFLVTLEERLKRRRILSDLHELRSIAHVIDMHQLTKDPTSMLAGRATASSPAREMSEFELTRYLDYCAELLSLTGKLAALYAQNMRDPVVIAAVNEIEALTAQLSQKIWQKIMILSRLGGDDEPPTAET